MLKNLSVQSMSKYDISINEDLSELVTYLIHESNNGNSKVSVLDNTSRSSVASACFHNPTIVHNIWSIHFTTDKGYNGILKDGFCLGRKNLDELSDLQYNSDVCEINNGWNFAYPIDNKRIASDIPYGEFGFLLKLDGVRAYHNDDFTDEIIFKQRHIKRLIPFKYIANCGTWCINYSFFKDCEKENLKNNVYFDANIGTFVFKSLDCLIEFVIEPVC